MVKDLVKILNCRERFAPRYELMKLAALSGAAPGSISSSNKAKLARLKQQLMGEGVNAVQMVTREVQAKGEFLPLMPHFPYDKVFTEGYAIPFEEADFLVQKMKLDLGQQTQQQQQQQEEREVQQKAGVHVGQKRQQLQQLEEDELLFSDDAGLRGKHKMGAKGVIRSRRRSVKRLRKQQAEQQQEQQQYSSSRATGMAGGEEGNIT
jgi:hypothetical protein